MSATGVWRRVRRAGANGRLPVARLPSRRPGDDGLPRPTEGLTDGPADPPAEASGEPAADPVEEPPPGPMRLPVPPVVRDLAGWAWRVLLFAVAAGALLWLAQRLYLVSLPMALSLILTALLSPVVGALRRRGLPRMAATGITMLAGLGTLVGLLTWVVRRAAESWPELVGQVTSTMESLSLRNETLARLRNEAVAQLEANRAQLTEGVVTGLTSAAEILTGTVLTVLFTLILLHDGDRMWAWLVQRLPASARPRVQGAAWPAWGRLSGWIRGTFIIAVIHAVVIGVSLTALRVPLVAPLVVLVFLGSFIPLFGAVIFGGLAVLVAFATQGLTAGLVLLGILLVANQIEAHALQPFLVGRYVRLHPFVVAVVITAGGLLWGVAGALLAVPLTAAVHAAITHLQAPAAPTC